MPQYLLTEKEFSALNEKRELSDIVNTGKLQEFCTHVANALPISYNWTEEIKPWGCIMNAPSSDLPNHGYCDDCPSQNICPCTLKKWSK